MEDTHGSQLTQWTIQSPHWFLPALVLVMAIAPLCPNGFAQPVPDPTSLPPAADPSPPKPAIETEEALPDDLSPDQRQQLLIDADRLWQQGRYADAEFLYRKAKNPFQAVAVSDRPAPVYDAAQLPPAGQVYWREFAAGREMNLITRMTVPLQLLTEQYPQFIPGHIQYAQLLTEQGQVDAALAILERAAARYAEQATLVRARVDALAAAEQWLEASIAARQFAVLYPDDPAALELMTLADTHLQKFRRNLREELTGNAIANVLTGALSYAVTGGIVGPLSAVQTSILMLQGESEVGENAAEQISEQLEIIEDEAIVSYLNEVGQRVARVSGRSDFEYQFYVVRDQKLNAFALPGGKVFVNAGAILKANSEAELAGLLAHEVSHAVLSHGFQLMTEGNTVANALDLIPYGGIASNLLILGYSRDMERQADALATRMLAASGYAADGLYNLMVTLDQQEDSTSSLEWLSTHPDTSDRIARMELQIIQNGYNRYAYEGVERHSDIQQQVRRLMEEMNEKQ